MYLICVLSIFCHMLNHMLKGLHLEEWDLTGDLWIDLIAHLLYIKMDNLINYVQPKHKNNFFSKFVGEYASDTESNYVKRGTYELKKAPLQIQEDAFFVHILDDLLIVGYYNVGGKDELGAMGICVTIS
ncbi:hypothetical protein ACJX0J_028233 [Zea mays]